MKYDFVQPTPELLQRLAETMRHGDVLECAAVGYAPLAMLEYSVSVSRDTIIALANGEPVCILGLHVPAVLSSIAQPWFLSSHGLANHKKALLHYSKTLVAHWLSEYDVLWNWVDTRYPQAIRWVEWLGFKATKEVMIGGIAFIQYELRKNV